MRQTSVRLADRNLMNVKLMWRLMKIHRVQVTTQMSWHHHGGLNFWRSMPKDSLLVTVTQMNPLSFVVFFLWCWVQGTARILKTLKVKLKKHLFCSLRLILFQAYLDTLPCLGEIVTNLQNTKLRLVSACSGIFAEAATLKATLNGVLNGWGCSNIDAPCCLSLSLSLSLTVWWHRLLTHDWW